MKKYTYLLLLLFVTLNLSAQVGINTDNSDPDASAMLDVKSTNKGMLVPRMTSDQRTMISNAAIGLLVFDTETESFWFRDSSGWVELITGGGALTHDDANNLVKPNTSAVDVATDDFVFGSTQLDDSGNADHDSRFFFDKSKGAFRAGIEEGDKWDETNRGIGSVALGNGNTAAGENSVAMGYQSGAMSIGAVSLGYQNGALGDVTVAIGNRNVVDTDTAFAIGSYNFADKDYALAVGTGNEAQEEASTAIGFANFATAIGASAFGEFNEANGESSLALGSGAIANGQVSIAIGSSNAEGMGSLAVGIDNTASGDFSQAIGSGITASSGFETVFGYFNTTYTPTNTGSPSPTDRLFSIGNGAGSSQRSDALIILKDGRTRINGPLTLGFSGNNLTNYTLPNIKGSTGQILRLNSSGMMEWADAGSATFLADTDNDTKIQVEESADEDVIRFDLGGIERMTFQKTANNKARLTFPNNNNNIFMGGSSGNFVSSGTDNIAIGNLALSTNQTSNFSIAIGPNALKFTTDGGLNIALGLNALHNNTTGSGNVGIGIGVGFTNQNGQRNVLVGQAAGRGNTDHDKSNNVMVGFEAGRTNEGDGNIFLGHQAGRNETGDNKLYIENSDSDVPLIYGDFDNDLVRINGELNIKNEYSLPATDGTSDQVLTTDGAGNTAWSDSEGVPVGSIMMWATTTPPDGWVVCNGQSITAYPQLVTVLGSNNAPNLQNKFPIGAGSSNSLGQTGGNTSVTLTETNIPKHNHDSGTLKTTYDYKSDNSSAGSASNRDGSDVRFYDGNAITGDTGFWGGDSNGDAQSFEIIPPYLALNFIIKAE